MKTILNRTLWLIACMAVLPCLGLSQYPEDILRLSYPGLGVGARALGMGTAYTGVANDFSATYWNPAGLAQMRLSEVSFGLGNVATGDQSSFFNNSQNFNNSSTSINGAGFVYPFPTDRGSLVVAVGYGRQANFTSGLSFSGFNPNSSIIQTWAPDGQSTVQSPSGNLAWELYLANTDSLGPNDFRWDSQIKGNLTQSGKVLEDGGMNTFSVAIASEAARDWDVGITLNFLTGSYAYTRNYYEDDFNNLHSTFPFDLTSLSLLETVNSDFSGFSATLGMLYKFKNSRFGLTVKTPSWITVKETFSQQGTSLFDDNFSASYATVLGGTDEYDITTPFVFSAGFSQIIQNLMLTGAIDYTDYTQMEFRNTDNQSLLDYNTQIKQEFRQAANFRVGGEYEIPDVGLRLRAGYAYLMSPYAGDPSSFARKYITGGLGFIIDNSVAIDLGYAHGSWDTFIYNYDATSQVNESITTNDLIGTVSYRF
ncbi:MAG TPA: outer membrane protein transport protein [Bacteroidota bacterium]|nr:outer membrane protein transport protein [Bacteroidota bacterium]